MKLERKFEHHFHSSLSNSFDVHAVCVIAVYILSEGERESSMIGKNCHFHRSLLSFKQKNNKNACSDFSLSTFH